MSEIRKQSAEVPKQEAEPRIVSFEQVREAINNGIGKIMEKIFSRGKLKVQDLLIELQKIAREQGVRPGDVQLGVTEINGLGNARTMTVSQNPNKRKNFGKIERAAPDGYSLVLTGALMIGACNRDGDKSQTFDTGEVADTSDSGEIDETGLDDTGEKECDPGLNPDECESGKYFDPDVEYDKPEEIADLHPPECGEKPEHAPDECGQQQWGEYAKDNPAAVVWAAIANTGTEACAVTVTRLELSYKSKNCPEELLSCGVAGTQMLSDGTGGDLDYWGRYVSTIDPQTTFDMDPGSGVYAHPFGEMIQVPEDAIDLEITIAAEITGPCAVSGGIDTYEESKSPEEAGPEYTNNEGKETDFIKEAIKTPWFTQTVNPEQPISYTIEHYSES